MAVATFTPEQVLRSIRYDPLTKKGSVYDVIRLVTGCETKHVGQTLSGITDKFPEVNANVTLHKFPGQGQRPTPVADLPTLFQLMAILPGSRSRNFARKSMDVFTRVFGADERLEPELKKRRVQLAEAGLQGVADGVSTTVEDALAELTKPLEPAVDCGIIYAATSPLQQFVKVGYWTGSLDALRARYAMYYGPQLQLRTWDCQQCRAVERQLLDEFATHSLGGELLDKVCLPDLVELLDTALAM